MRCPTLEELPPPMGKSGWPWTTATPQLPDRSASDAWPRITIITPVLNQAEFVEETIRSVLLQGYPDLEYLVLDGGSTDGSAEIVQRYSRWLTYWRSAPDDGQPAAINDGLRRATGSIFAWCNSDDYYFPGAFARVVEAFRRQERVFFAGAVEHIGAGARAVVPSARLDFRHLVEFWRRDHAVMRDQGLFYPTALLSEVGLLDTSLHFAFDYDFLIRATRVLQPIYSDQAIATWRFHGTSKTVRQAHRWVDEILAISQRYWSEIPGVDVAACERFVAGWRFRHGLAALLTEPRSGVRLMRDALRTAPGAVLTSTFFYALRRLGFHATPED